MQSKLLAGTASLALAGVLALVAGWYFFVRSDAPPAVSLEGALGSAGMGGGAAFDPAGDVGLAGQWRLAAGGASFAGYRVVQQVAGIGSEPVVGRSPELTGSLTFDGNAVTAAEVTVDMTALRSDESLRDRVLRSEAIETADFPNATFVLTGPISVPAVPPEGQQVMQTVSGELTLHGVTRPVEVAVQAALQGGRLVVVGSHEIQFEDFDITPPRGPASVLSVEDQGIFEVQLVFDKAA
jgi:polyisoprenoid-binding protein YceI